MPTYVYGDDNGHHKELVMSFDDADRAIVFCDECDGIMHRIPQPVSVNWNGLPPHLENTRPPIVKKFVDTAPERRARYLDTERKK